MSTTTTTDHNHELLELFDQFYRDYYRDEIGELARDYPTTRSLYIDWTDLYQYDPSLADDWLTQPETVQQHAEEALRQFDIPLDISLNDAHVRLYNLNDADTISIPRLQARHLGDYVAVTGDLSKVSQDVPRPREAGFECQRCGTVTEVPQYGSDLQEPGECHGCERKGPFTLSAENTDWEDYQQLRLTQPAGEIKSGQGASVDVILRDDAVEPLGDGRLTPGNRVTVNGIYTVRQTRDGQETYIQAQSVTVEDTDYSNIDYTDEEIERFHEVANGEEGDPYELFKQSLAPNHYGDEHIKLGITLQLFRGVRTRMPDGSWQRGDTHILIIGDPSMGKSVLLSRAAQISPRSAQTSGKGASAAGLTAAAVPSDFGDEKWSVEAGALVHADKGLAAVDEIDKVDDDAVSAMHDALEGDQTVKFSKAGINTDLPARCSLLAAGNPDYGRFDRADEIMTQVDISPTLLSRFDLMFTLEDNPEQEEDKVVAENMVRDRQLGHAAAHEDGVEPDETIDPPFDHEFFRKYIAYARRTCYPRLDPHEDEEVLDHLVSLFLDLREPVYDDQQSVVPVTRRKIEGLQRLSEASARLRLSDRVEKEDVNRAARLVLKSMRDLGVNEDGQFDADVVETGYSRAQRDAIDLILDMVREKSDEYEDGVPVSVLQEMVADTNGLDWNRAEFQIEKLKQQGKLYEPSSGRLRTT